LVLGGLRGSEEGDWEKFRFIGRPERKFKRLITGGGGKVLGKSLGGGPKSHRRERRIKSSKSSERGKKNPYMLKAKTAIFSLKKVEKITKKKKR